MCFPKQPSKEVYLYNRANWDEIRQKLFKASNTYFNIDSVSDKSVEENWNFIHQTVLTLMNKFIPTKTSTTRYM